LASETLIFKINNSKSLWCTKRKEISERRSLYDCQPIVIWLLLNLVTIKSIKFDYHQIRFIRNNNNYNKSLKSNPLIQPNISNIYCMGWTRVFGVGEELIWIHILVRFQNLSHTDWVALPPNVASTPLWKMKQILSANLRPFDRRHSDSQVSVPNHWERERERGGVERCVTWTRREGRGIYIKSLPRSFLSSSPEGLLLRFDC